MSALAAGRQRAEHESGDLVSPTALSSRLEPRRAGLRRGLRFRRRWRGLRRRWGPSWRRADRRDDAIGGGV